MRQTRQRHAMNPSEFSNRSSDGISSFNQQKSLMLEMKEEALIAKFKLNAKNASLESNDHHPLKKEQIEEDQQHSIQEIEVEGGSKKVILPIMPQSIFSKRPRLNRNSQINVGISKSNKFIPNNSSMPQFDYIEVDQQKYQEAMNYLTQIPLQSQTSRKNSTVNLLQTINKQPNSNRKQSVLQLNKIIADNSAKPLPPITISGTPRNKSNSNANNQNLKFQEIKRLSFSGAFENGKLDQTLPTSLSLGNASTNLQRSQTPRKNISNLQLPSVSSEKQRYHSLDQTTANRSRDNSKNPSPFYNLDSIDNAEETSIMFFDSIAKNPALSSVPFNENLYEKLQSYSKETSSNFLKFSLDMQDINIKPKKRSNSENQKGNIGEFKSFAKSNFAPDSFNRLKTFFKFAFTSTDKEENFQITNALDQFIDDFQSQGTMQIIDLWSNKQLKKCLQRTNMKNERAVIQSFLYYKAKYDQMKAEEERQVDEFYSKKKEQFEQKLSERRSEARKAFEGNKTRRSDFSQLNDKEYNSIVRMNPVNQRDKIAEQQQIKKFNKGVLGIFKDIQIERKQILLEKRENLEEEKTNALISKEIDKHLRIYQNTKQAV